MTAKQLDQQMHDAITEWLRNHTITRCPAGSAEGTSTIGRLKKPIRRKSEEAKRKLVVTNTRMNVELRRFAERLN